MHLPVKVPSPERQSETGQEWKWLCPVALVNKGFFSHWTNSFKLPLVLTPISVWGVLFELIMLSGLTKIRMAFVVLPVITDCSVIIIFAKSSKGDGSLHVKLWWVIWLLWNKVSSTVLVTLRAVKHLMQTETLSFMWILGEVWYCICCSCSCQGLLGVICPSSWWKSPFVLCLISLLGRYYFTVTVSICLQVLLDCVHWLLQWSLLHIPILARTKEL